MSQQLNLSQQYKGYKARKKAEGSEALDFNTWKRMYGTRKPRTSKAASNGHVTAPVVNQNQALIEQAQALIAQLSGQVTQDTQPAVKQAQPSQGHVEIRNPDEQATGRQLWKLMNLGVIPFISKGDASQMIEDALVTA